ncbi:MAG: helix-turn-helix transcriptional regulator, partial [Raoultibacter sp.]
AALFLAVANSSSLVNCAIALISIVASSIFLSTQTNEEPSAKIRVNPQQNIVMSARHMGAITLFAIFALGFFTQLLSIVSLVPSQAQEGTAEGDAAVACATASIILLLGLAVHRLKKTNRFDSLEASLTFCLVFIACAVLAAGYTDNNTIFSVVFSSCTRLSFLMVLIVLLISVSNSNSESRPTLCLGLATLYSGYFIGGLLGEMQVSGNDITTALLLALSLLLVALMLVLVRNMKSSIQIAPDCAGSSSAESTLSNYHSFAESQGLTPRQTEVLRWLATGRSSAYIAKQMNISENTAKAHVSKIYERLNVHSRDELLDLLENYTQSDTR